MGSGGYLGKSPTFFASIINDSVRVPRTYDRQSIHAPNHNSVRVPKAYCHHDPCPNHIIPFVFQGHTVTSASMPKPKFRSCSKCIRSSEHPCQNHNSVRGPRAYDTSVRVPRAYGDQSMHAQAILPLVFQEHTVIGASMPKPKFRSCSKSIRRTVLHAQT